MDAVCLQWGWQPVALQKSLDYSSHHALSFLVLGRSDGSCILTFGLTYIVCTVEKPSGWMLIVRNMTSYLTLNQILHPSSSMSPALMGSKGFLWLQRELFLALTRFCWYSSTNQSQPSLAGFVSNRVRWVFHIPGDPRNRQSSLFFLA